MRGDDKLNIELGTWHPVGFLAARALAAAWGPTASIVSPWGTRGGATVIRLELGSLVRPSVVVRFEQPYAAPEAEALALTTAAWDALDGGEPWRDLTAPLGGFARLGRPDARRAWHVSLAPVDVGAAQLHLLGGRPRRRALARGAVWWPRLGPVAAALLGRAEAVRGEDDPLVHDAIRAGVAVPEASIVPGRLAGLVPPSLLGCEPLWREVAAMARSGRPEPLMTPAWIERGRRRLRERQAAPKSGVERARRRLLKLQRDPRRFLADSRHGPLRAVGRWVAAEQDDA